MTLNLASLRDLCERADITDSEFIHAALIVLPAAIEEIERLRGEAVDTKESLRCALQAVRDQFPASVATIREMRDEALSERDAARAEVERMRTLVVEACGIADLALPTVPCDMSFEVARIASIRAEVVK